MTLTFILIANMLEISSNLLSSVCWVESKHRNVINHKDNGSPSYGVCQVKLNTAHFMNNRHQIHKYLNSEDLMIPEINILYAALYLKYQLHRYGDVRRAISAYNAGRAIKSNKGYVDKVMKRIEGDI